MARIVEPEPKYTLATVCEIRDRPGRPRSRRTSPPETASSPLRASARRRSRARRSGRAGRERGLPGTPHGAGCARSLPGAPPRPPQRARGLPRARPRAPTRARRAGSRRRCSTRGDAGRRGCGRPSPPWSSSRSSPRRARRRTRASLRERRPRRDRASRAASRGASSRRLDAPLVTPCRPRAPQAPRARHACPSRRPYPSGGGTRLL